MGLGSGLVGYSVQWFGIVAEQPASRLLPASWLLG